MIVFGKTWEKWEEDELRRVYPGHGAAGCLLAMPYRSVKAIRQRATEMGVRRDGRYARHKEGWTQVEDDLIRKLYPEGGAIACAPMMPNRTIAAIRSRAKRMGLSMPAQRSPVPVHDYTEIDRLWIGSQARLPAWGVVARFGVPSIGVAA